MSDFCNLDPLHVICLIAGLLIASGCGVPASAPPPATGQKQKTPLKELVKQPVSEQSEPVAVTDDEKPVTSVVNEPLKSEPKLVEARSKLGFETPGFDEWVSKAAALPVQEQIEAVNQKLAELNPGFEGNLFTTEKDGVVTVARTEFRETADLSPLRAFTGLKSLYCWQTKVTDLSPLQGIKLIHLNCVFTSVSDLSPLKGMALEELECNFTQISDLSPLTGMPLRKLTISGTRVVDLSSIKSLPLVEIDCSTTKINDLSPLTNMPLMMLNCSQTNVSDLSPLKDAKLKKLGCVSTKVSDLSSLQDNDELTELLCSDSNVTDLSPLRGKPLTSLDCDFKSERDAELLRSIKTLEWINGKKAAEFWEAVEIKQ